MRLIIWLLLGYCAYLLLKGKRGKEISAPPASRGDETHRDPVCGLYVSEEDAVVGRVEGERIYFCSMNCLEKYREKLES